MKPALFMVLALIVLIGPDGNRITRDERIVCNVVAIVLVAAGLAVFVVERKRKED